MTASAVTRLNSVTYGGFKVGEGTTYHLDGPLLIDEDYTSLRVRFQVLVHDTTEATFRTAEAALLAAYRVQNGDLVVTANGTNIFNLSHSSNTGMLGSPSISLAREAQSLNTALYVCSVLVQLPADESGKSGRQSSRVSYSSDGAEIVQLSVQAVYTGLSSNDSLAQAKAAFPTYITTLQGVEGGTWDEVDALTYTHDSDDKVCQASASYRQIIANQSSGTLNNTTLQGVDIQVLSSTPTSVAEKGSGAKPLQSVEVRFFANVRKSVSTDLLNVWESIVRPHMIAVASDLTGVSNLTPTSTDPGLLPHRNQINASIKFVGVRSSLISSQLVTAESDLLPFSLEPVLNGDPYARDRHAQPGSRTATILATVFEVDTDSDRSLAGLRAVERLYEQQGYHVRARFKELDIREERDGIGLGNPLSLRLRRFRVELEFANIVGGSGSGGGRRVGRTRTRG